MINIESSLCNTYAEFQIWDNIFNGVQNIVTKGIYDNLNVKIWLQIINRVSSEMDKDTCISKQTKKHIVNQIRNQTWKI